MLLMQNTIEDVHAHRNCVEDSTSCGKSSCMALTHCFTVLNQGCWQDICHMLWHTCSPTGKNQLLKDRMSVPGCPKTCCIAVIESAE